MCEFCQKAHDMTGEPGNAQPRCRNQPATMYDLIPAFNEFKKEESQLHKEKGRKYEVIKNCEKFVKFGDSIDDDKRFEILKHQFRPSEDPTGVEYPRSNTGAVPKGSRASGSTDIDSAKQKLIKISRKPIKCPDAMCGSDIGFSHILTHFLKEHADIDTQELFGQKRLIMRFAEKTLPYGKPTMIAIILYGGKKEGEDNAGLCVPNALIGEDSVNTHFRNHLPICVMACKTHMSTLSPSCRKLYREDHAEEDIVCIWLTSAETTIPMSTTLTVFDNTLHHARSNLMLIRDVRLPQYPEGFLSTEIDYIILRRFDLNTLSHNQAHEILLEVYVHMHDNFGCESK